MTPESFKARRLELGLTQPALGALIGKDRISIYRYEYGRVKIPRSVELAMGGLRTRKARPKRVVGRPTPEPQ